MTRVGRHNTVAHLSWEEMEDDEFVATCAIRYDVHTRWPNIYSYMVLEADAVPIWVIISTLAEIPNLV